MAAPRLEPVLALRHPIGRVPVAERIRGTVLASSLSALDALSLTDAYYDALPEEHRKAMRALAVNAWHPMALALVHYGAIESLGLSDEQARANGRLVADRVQKTYLATLVRSLGLGITPWSFLGRFQSVLDRLIENGSGAVYRMGPKDARVEIHGAPIARFAYVRGGWAGMLEGGLELVSRKVYCRDVSLRGTQTLASFVVSWA
jgi:hypothetical protein